MNNLKPKVNEFFDTIVTLSRISERKAILYIYDVMDQWCEDCNVDNIRSAVTHAPIELIPDTVLLGLLTAARWRKDLIEAEYKSLATRIRGILEFRGLVLDRVNNCMQGLE